MKCPNDETVLQMTAREGIEIDYCPQCRGVWLDRGELDKLIERSGNTAVSTPAPTVREQQDVRPSDPSYQQQQQRHYDNDDRHYYSKKKRKESIFSDLFDF